MATATDAGCCKRLMDAQEAVNELIFTVKTSVAGVELFCNSLHKNNSCKFLPATRKRTPNCLQIITDLFSVVDKLKQGVEIHEASGNYARRPSGFSDTSVAIPYENSLKCSLANPCEIGLDDLLQVRKKLKISLVELEYHNDKGEECEQIMRSKLQPSQILDEKVTENCRKALDELSIWIKEHNECCSRAQKILDHDSGFVEDGGHPVQRFGRCIGQETNSTIASPSEETEVKSIVDLSGSGNND